MSKKMEILQNYLQSILKLPLSDRRVTDEYRQYSMARQVGQIEVVVLLREDERLLSEDQRLLSEDVRTPLK